MTDPAVNTEITHPRLPNKGVSNAQRRAVRYSDDED